MPSTSHEIDYPDLIILDIFMPGILGLDVFMQLKSMPLTSEIPVIILSVASDTQEKMSSGHQTRRSRIYFQTVFNRRIAGENRRNH